MSRTLSTHFYKVATSTDGLVQMGVALQARLGRNGLFAVREASMDTDPNGAGVIENPFGIIDRIMDRFGGYADYTFTQEAAQRQLDQFSERHRQAGNPVLAA